MFRSDELLLVLVLSLCLDPDAPLCLTALQVLSDITLHDWLEAVCSHPAAHLPTRLSPCLQGPTGPVGETGVPGPQGPQGPQGSSGRSIIGSPV